MLYEIRGNKNYSSNEVYFKEIPPYEVRENLKKLKMRWNRKKACWYGFASESESVHAIQGGDDKAQIVTDGYLGGSAVYGGKSN